jgi:uncharacterized membrane protein YphA (DoxX/SURF4 family)
MDTLLKVGRFCFAISIAFFGLQYLLYGRLVGGLPPVPPWTPGSRVLAYLIGVALIAPGLSIATLWHARLSATALGVLFLVCVVFLHAMRASEVLHDGIARTRAFEPLALSGVAFVLAAILPLQRSYLGPPIGVNRLILLGRILFALSLIVFGVQHFMYAPFIAFLVPSWIPGHLFWAYFTGIALIAAGLSIATKMFAPVAATLLGVMFVLWVLVLHAPRVVAQPRNGDEWTSAFVALAFAGGSFILAAALSKARVRALDSESATAL